MWPSSARGSDGGQEWGLAIGGERPQMVNDGRRATVGQAGELSGIGLLREMEDVREFGRRWRLDGGMTIGQDRRVDGSGQRIIPFWTGLGWVSCGPDVGCGGDDWELAQEQPQPKQRQQGDG